MRKTARAALFDTPVGFDDPLEVLFGCHRRIERQLQTLQRLRAHVEARGVDAEASAAAQAVLGYFARAGVNHQDDEERDLFPMLEARITEPGEATRFRTCREGLESAHRQLAEAWARLRKPLEGIGEGLTRALPAADVGVFVTAYATHIRSEETILKEFFDRWLDAGDRRALGRSMAARRMPPPPRP